MTATVSSRRPHRRVGRRPHLVLGLVVASMLGALLGFEQGATAGPTTPLTDDQQAVTLLQRAVGAAGTVSYTGSQTVTVFSGSGSVTAMVRITHLAGRGTVVQPAGSAYLPTTSAYLPTPTPGIDADRTRATIADLVDTYQITLAAKPSWPVGRKAWVIVARQADGQIAARFWLDQATGMMLRRQVYGKDGVLERSSAFTDLRLRGVAELPGAATPPLTLTLVPTTTVTVDQARAAGWQVPEELGAGNKLLGLTTRAGGSVVHLTYTDGVTMLSVFEQPGQLDPTALTDATANTVAGHRVYLHDGLPSYAVWSSAGKTYTVVGDTPDEVTAAVWSLPHDPARTGGALARIRRGMHKLYGWLDPLD